MADESTGEWGRQATNFAELARLAGVQGARRTIVTLGACCEGKHRVKGECLDNRCSTWWLGRRFLLLGLALALIVAVIIVAMNITAQRNVLVTSGPRAFAIWDDNTGLPCVGEAFALTRNLSEKTNSTNGGISWPFLRPLNGSMCAKIQDNVPAIRVRVSLEKRITAQSVSECDRGHRPVVQSPAWWSARREVRQSIRAASNRSGVARMKNPRTLPRRMDSSANSFAPDEDEQRRGNDGRAAYAVWGDLAAPAGIPANRFAYFPSCGAPTRGQPTPPTCGCRFPSRTGIRAMRGRSRRTEYGEGIEGPLCVCCYVTNPFSFSTSTKSS
jgi:hypothetical protein